MKFHTCKNERCEARNEFSDSGAVRYRIVLRHSGPGELVALKNVIFRRIGSRSIPFVANRLDCFHDSVTDMTVTKQDCPKILIIRCYRIEIVNGRRCLFALEIIYLRIRQEKELR